MIKSYAVIIGVFLIFIGIGSEFYLLSNSEQANASMIDKLKMENVFIEILGLNNSTTFIGNYGKIVATYNGRELLLDSGEIRYRITSKALLGSIPRDSVLIETWYITILKKDDQTLTFIRFQGYIPKIQDYWEASIWER